MLVGRERKICRLLNLLPCPLSKIIMVYCSCPFCLTLILGGLNEFYCNEQEESSMWEELH